MKIAFINQPFDGSLPPKQTSLSIWSYQVARRLAPHADVTVYGRKHNAGDSVEQVDGVRYVHVPAKGDRRVIRFLERWSASRPITRPLVTSRWYCRGYAKEVARDLQARGCDFALLFNYSQFVPVIRKYNPRIKVTLDMQCEWLTQFDRDMLKRRLRCLDAIVGCSGYIAEKIHRRFPEFRGPCRPVFNGVDVGHFSGNGCSTRSSAHPKRVLFVGRISPEKGVHVLLDAFRVVLERFGDAELEIVGSQAECPREILVDLSDDPKVKGLERFYDGRGYSTHLQEQIDAAGMNDRVTFAGFVPHAEAAAHYHAADVLVNPSLSEAFGMSLAEAMASSRPVVATRVGGMTEVVDDNVTGRLVEPDDAEALAGAIIDILSDPARGRTMGVAGRERANALFSWDRIAAEVRQLAEEL